jgi:GNAT superfamily N-acetyltransferase
MTTPRLYRHIGAETLLMLDTLADVYDEIYAEPPYSSGPLFARSEFLQRTRSQVHADGFTLITAQAAENSATGELAGFSFGLSFGTGWWGGDTTPPPTELNAATKFPVIELLVRQPFRGMGLGRTMLNELLAERPEKYAMLTSVPEAPAHEMYERWGWHKVGTALATPYAPVMDVMTLGLKATKDSTPTDSR